MTMSITRLTLLLLMFGAAGCIDFKETGKNLGSGLSDGIKQNADTVGARLGAGVVQGARDTLTSTETQQRLNKMLDDLGQALARQAAASRDSLLGASTKRWIEDLRSSLIGATTQEQLARLRDELLGAKTAGFLRDSLRSAASGLRDEMLGGKTQAAIDSIIASAITTLSEQYREKMQPIVHQEEGFVQKNASTLLWMAGGVIVVVLVAAGIIFMRRKKDQHLLGLLTNQIHDIPRQDAYDELVARIQRNAQNQGLEPRLQQVLRDYGLLGESSWKPRQPSSEKGR